MLKQKIKTKNQANTSQHERIGPEILPEKIATHVDSCLYVKKLIALSISNITYLRGLLSNDCFVDRLFDDLPVKILKGNDGKSEVLKNLSSWIQGAYEAIDKKYVI
jgi:meiosis-specific protein HOP1